MFPHMVWSGLASESCRPTFKFIDRRANIRHAFGHELYFLSQLHVPVSSVRLQTTVDITELSLLLPSGFSIHSRPSSDYEQRQPPVRYLVRLY